MRPNDPAWRLEAAALILSSLAALPALAADKPCGAAGKAIDNVTSWAALERAQADYGHCDTGPVADAFTEAMLRVIIDGWPKLPEAGPIFERNAAFRGWVDKRLSGARMPAEESKEVRNLAKGSCPKGQEKLCADFANAVEMGRALFAPETLLLPPITTAPAAPPKAK